MSRFLTLALLCMSTACSAAQAAPKAQAPKRAPITVIGPQIQASQLHDLLSARRALNLNRLLAYANAGAFPLNTQSDGPLNIFVDDQGHICAAANLIDKDGYGKLVHGTASQNNYIVLGDVKKGPLLDWMLTSGFTQEEIALIQEPYMPVGIDEPQGDPAVPTPIFAVAPVDGEVERERVRKVLLNVHSLLRASNKKGLGMAVARLQANPVLAQRLVDGAHPSGQPTPRFAVAP